MLPSGAISESSPSSGCSATKATRKAAPFHGAIGEDKTASSAASAQTPDAPCAWASAIGKRKPPAINNDVVKAAENRRALRLGIFVLERGTRTIQTVTFGRKHEQGTGYAGFQAQFVRYGMTAESFQVVMAGLVPAIPLRLALCFPKRDHRANPGDDNGAAFSLPSLNGTRVYPRSDGREPAPAKAGGGSRGVVIIGKVNSGRLWGQPRWRLLAFLGAH